ncbi:hypothetical protein RI367_004903 [Sorochytrium milnesiophthora]
MAFVTPQKPTQRAYPPSHAWGASPTALFQTPTPAKRSTISSAAVALETRTPLRDLVPAPFNNSVVPADDVSPHVARQLSRQLLHSPSPNSSSSALAGAGAAAGKRYDRTSPAFHKVAQSPLQSPAAKLASPWSRPRAAAKAQSSSSMYLNSPTPPRYHTSWHDPRRLGDPVGNLTGLLTDTLSLSAQKKKKFTYDRFVPDTTAIDFSTTQFRFESEDFTKALEVQGYSDTRTTLPLAYMDDSTRVHQQDIAEACGIALNQRILSSEQTTTQPTGRDRLLNSFNHANTTSTVGGGGGGGKRQTTQQQHHLAGRSKRAPAVRRNIPTAPSMVLDAPGLASDFYLNVVDWSSTNQLAIALGNTVYVMDVATNSVTEFCTVTSSSRNRRNNGAGTSASAVAGDDATGPVDAFVEQQGQEADEELYVTSLSWALDGSHLAIGTVSGQTQIWDVQTQTRLRKMGGHSARVGVLAWENYMVSSGSMDGSIWRHDVRVSKHNVAQFRGHELEVCGLKYQRPHRGGADYQYFASGGNDNVVNIWDVRSADAPVHSKSEHLAAVKALAWSPHASNLLATGGGTADSNIHFWNTSSGALLNTIYTGSQITSLVWSTEYKEIMAAHGYPSNQLTLWSYPSLYKVAELEGHAQRILHMCGSPDGQSVATASIDENIKIWPCWQPSASTMDAPVVKNGEQAPAQTVSQKKGVKVKPLAIDEHRLPLEEICKRYNVQVDPTKPTNSQGLSEADAKQRLAEHGANMLTPPKKRHPILIYLHCLATFFNMLLLFAGILTFVLYGIDTTDNYLDLWIGIILVCVAFLNAFIEFYQLQKSSKILESFLNMIPAKCNAIRERQLKGMSAVELVPGDVVFVRMGDKVPADLLMFQCADMKVDNSSLTGESEPQERHPTNHHENVLEAANVAFNSTLVVSGEGYGIVIRTGDHTVIGQIAGLTAGENKRPSPLSEEINSFVLIIGTIACATALIFFLVALLQKGASQAGSQFSNAFTFAIGVMTAWVPEGLPATVTMLLTIAAKRMATENVLVKDLQGVETLGAITMLCTDKTGTLTRNQMTVSNLWTHFKMFSVLIDQRSLAEREVPFDSSVQGIQDIMLISAVCSRARFDRVDVPIEQREIVGDATETGLYRLATQKLKNFDKLSDMYPKVFEIPFNSDTKTHMSIHKFAHSNGALTLFLKGAPERVLKNCSFIAGEDGRPIPLEEEHTKMFNDSYEYMASKGHRVLAFAKLELPASQYPEGYVFNKEEKNYPVKGLVFVGIASLEDPPKHGVREAVGHARRAGIRVVMVTGDHPLTAEAIGRKINLMLHDTKEKMSVKLNRPAAEIPEDTVKAIVIHGELIEGLQPDDWDNIFSKEEIIFARTSPKHKLQIVKYAQSLGHIVGVTGDGVNDSPALKKADLGIAMNMSGSDVSKEAASMILLDDNFASTIRGIREGRLIFMNLKKSIQYVVSHIIPEVVPQLLYVVVPLPSMLNALQILVIDLGFELLAALSYAYEPPESDSIMKLPPRKPVTNESIIHLRNKRDFDQTFRRVDVEAGDEDQERPLTFKERMHRLQSWEYWRRYKFGPSFGEVLVDNGVLSWAYLEAGVIETLGAMLTFFLVAHDYGNYNTTPTDLRHCINGDINSPSHDQIVKFGNSIGTATGFAGFDGSQGVDCMLGNGQILNTAAQKELLAQATAAYYMSVMIGQMFNLMACKCRLRSPFSPHIFRNRYTWLSIVAGVLFGVFIVYTPGVETVFATSGKFRGIWYLVPIGFGILLFLYSGLRFWIKQKFRPVTFTPEPIGLQMHPTRWSRNSRSSR